MAKAKALPVDELLRLACIYAEQDREEMLRCLHDGDPEAEEVRAFLRQLKAYRLKRWGQTKLEHVIATAREKLATEIVAEAWQRCEHAWGDAEEIREPNFNVKLGTVSRCAKCGARKHDDWTAARASSVERILPPID